MLRPDEFTVGALKDTTPLSLLLPRSKYEQPILVGGTEDEPIAVFIGDKHAFHSFACAENDAWKGLIVPNVRIEADPDSLFSDSDGIPVGALVREGDRLLLWGISKASGFPNAVGVELVCNLSPAPEHMRAAFSRWQIVIGEGNAQRTMKQVDVGAQPA